MCLPSQRKLLFKEKIYSFGHITKACLFEYTEYTENLITKKLKIHI